MTDRLAGPAHALGRSADMAVLLCVLALYVTVGLTSPGFDDEIYTIQVTTVAEDFGTMIAILAREDVHPPGSYVVVRALFLLTGDWSLVRAITGACVAVSLWALWRTTAPRTPAAVAFACMAICFAPTVLLWGATLRWYSWFIPVGIGLLLLIHRNPRERWTFWPAFAAIAVVLVHVGYFALPLLPGFAAAALVRRRASLRREAPAIRVSAAAFCGLVAPQLAFVLPNQLALGLSVHEHGFVRQVGGAGLHLFLGQAAMPASVSAVAFGIGNLVLFAAAVRRGWRPFSSSAAIVVICGTALVLAGGVAGHFRSQVTLSPAQGVWQAELFAGIRRALWKGIAGAAFAIATTSGLWNVVSHSETSKRSWNMPYPALMQIIERERRDCAALSVLTYDPVLAWHLQGAGVTTLNPQDEESAAAFRDLPGCAIAVETYRGSLPAPAFQRFAEAVDSRPGPRRVSDVGVDPQAAFKRRFQPEVPDFMARLTIFGGAPAR